MPILKFAIPSYNRVDILKSNTIAMLEHYKIPKKQIYIFVVEEEYQQYKDALPDYKNIIIGVKGLYNQRNFITNYFKEGQYIVNLDDDIKKLNSLDNQNFKQLDNFITEINKAFKLCQNHNAFIWGISQTNNDYFMRESITFDFRFLVGHLWGCINRHSSDLQITIDIKEDYERCIKYWLKDKTIIKLNYISADTIIYDTKGGLQLVYPDRTEASKTSCELLLLTYPTYFKIRTTQLNNLNDSRYWELRCRQHHISPNNYYTPLEPINKDCIIINSILEYLKNNKLELNYKRLNSGIGQSQCFGKYRIRKKAGLYDSKNNDKYPELYQLLQDFGNKYVIQHIPEYTSIQVNYNYQSKPHYDRNNGNSFIVGFGNYSGGDIIINSYKHSICYRPILFNGKNWLHSTDVFCGNRITLIYFKQNYKKENVILS